MITRTQEPELEAAKKKVIREKRNRKSDRDFYARLLRQIERITAQAIAAQRLQQDNDDETGS